MHSQNTSTPPLKRGSVACRRCRRLRSKCIHSAAPPCDACRRAGPGVAAECVFPRKGEKDTDRSFRRRMPPPAALRADPSAPAASRDVPRPLALSAAGLPPMDQVIAGCRIFVTSYFQLGFIPKTVFMEKLRRDPAAVSPFLLVCILCISARFTPVLRNRYGGARQATDYFVAAARAMVPTEMYTPSLERIQAFFLLAISQWGDGDRDRSSIDMGVAVRMAALLKLHCEESYVLPADAPAEDIVQSESARRTFWMIQSQENLHSGYKTPAPFPLQDITTLLPCDEKEFAFACIPPHRAAVAGTPPAVDKPHLVYAPDRCLFATLIQVHQLWGRVARRACRADSAANKRKPWDTASEYAVTVAELHRWEASLPASHVFSVWNLRGWKTENLHLAYLSMTMVLRLANIVVRRIYLDDILSELAPHASEMGQPISAGTSNMAGGADDGPPVPTVRYTDAPTGFWDAIAPEGFWETMATELFFNVEQLHDQIDAYFALRAPEEGFPQILVFCVYICGSLASCLWRYPSLCMQRADKAEGMARRALEVLGELHQAWPMSLEWQRGLQKAQEVYISESNV
ncbi:hypothetical protein TD95_003510 [Thielaviopsis punctulata]|uniref:Zn(2)-C6 fungal-type domain-containing protein n=1 Tax=Thielaviopsis punctulata TaxID=72032 RepID=A0A0F4Z8B4_9PEZI|nr:hypothetical protein TD95_003510 [Thielaviopsis punctulata]